MPRRSCRPRSWCCPPATRVSALKWISASKNILNDAVSSWLPQSLSGDGQQSRSCRRQALFFLADLTSQQHNDRWFSDLLRVLLPQIFLQRLRRSPARSKPTTQGKYDVATEQSVRAHGLFRASGNVAGSLRGEFEQTFAAQLTRQSEAVGDKQTAGLGEIRRIFLFLVAVQIGLEKRRLFLSNGRHRR